MTTHFFGRTFVASAFASALTLTFVAGTTQIAHATVGGPTYVYDFSYNPANESVYYIRHSFNGRGCPPELMHLSLADSTIQTAYSCDEGETLLTPSTGYDLSPVVTKIANLTKTFKPLVPINLKKNDISVDVRFVNIENISPDVNEIQKANFAATVRQAGVKLAEFPIVGCNPEQPFSFAGYDIPGFEKKIVLLLSSKGDCWEGGYTRESLHVVGGLNDLDKTSLNNVYKGASALVPNEGTLVTYAKDAAAQTGNTKTYQLVGILILGLVAGLALGKVRK